MDAWYFAYGSNLWIEQMVERTGSIGHAEHVPRIAHLESHRLVFQCLTEGGPAFANIVHRGDGVWGVAYRCSAAALTKLDRYEGGYERQTVTVTDLAGEILAAIAYIMPSSGASQLGLPSAAYLERIVTGARQQGLPEEYIKSLEELAR